MTTCNSRRSLWTVAILGLLFAAFIGGTQVPIQFSIGKRAESMPVTLVPEHRITSAGYNTPALPTTVAFNDVVTSPVYPPVAESPTVNNTPTSLPPIPEPSVPTMPPVVSPPMPIPPQLEIKCPPPNIPLPLMATSKDDESTAAPPPLVFIYNSDTPNPQVSQPADKCNKHSIDTNIQSLANALSQKAGTEKEIAEIASALRNRLDCANEELNDKGAPVDKQVDHAHPMADRSIDQMLGQIKQMRANKANLDGQILTLKRAIRTQFDELQKQVRDLSIMDVEPFSQPASVPPT